MNVVLAVFMTATSFFSEFREKSREIERTIATSPSQRIEIKGFSGSKIEFKSWDKNEVFIKLSVRISSSSDEYEDEYIKSVNVTERSSPTTVTVTFDETEGRFHEGFFRKIFSFGGSYVRKDIRGEIYVPKSNSFYTDLKYGSLSLGDMKGKLELDGQSNTLELKNCSSVHSIKNNYGKTILDNCGGSLNLESQSGTVKIEDFKGSVDVSAKYSTITVNRVSEATRIESQSGKLNFEDIQGDLTVNSDYSTLSINRVKGFVDVSNKSGKIRIKTVDGVKVDALYSDIEVVSVSGKANKPVEVRGQSGRLELVDVVGHVTIENPYSSMVLRNIKGDVELSSQSAKVMGDNIAGNWNSKTLYSSITLTNLAAQIVSISNQSNPVEVNLTVKPSKIEIVNTYANVTLSFPGPFSGDVRLKAVYGKVSSNLPLEIENMGSGAIAVGKIGNGTGSLRVETTSGNIKVNQK